MALDGIKLVSGGQTGAHRAALDSASKHGNPHVGWCPNGRKAEGGPVDAGHPLKEWASGD